MKTKTHLKSPFYIFMVTVVGILSMSRAIGQQVETTNYYAVEMTGVVCGYVIQEISREDDVPDAGCSVHEEVNVKLSILGQGTDIGFNTVYELAPECDKVTAIDRKVTTGGASFKSSTKVNGNKLWNSSDLSGTEKTIDLPPGTIIESPLSYPHLLDDFILGNDTVKTYLVYEDLRGNLEEKKYSLKGEEEMKLADMTHQVAEFEELNLVTGTNARIWIRKNDGFPVKIEISGRKIYLSDPSVLKQITIANADDLIFARVDKTIEDFQNLNYMKVRGTIQTAGEWLTAESLNFPGQSFTGTVENNLIEGVFEIKPVRYDGKNAPAFPPGFSKDEALQQYLKPGELIESDDPLLVSEAEKITRGSANSWEAAVRLSKWVAEEIRGAIPGGTSAINTYKIREGECGSHSRLLAAFCRAVGIPARLSVGCMYSPYYGGSFGQHAWTEVWMGQAGWVAVDATIFEFDYVDAGHIRLGEKTTFNPTSMEIIDYRTDAGAGGLKPELKPDHELLIGNYSLMENGKVFVVTEQNGGLAVKIPGQMTLALNEPDEEGRWYPQMTRQISFTFETGDDKRVEKMWLQQLVPVNRSADPDLVPDDVPGAIIPLLGTYVLPAASLNLDVFYKEGNLYVIDSNDPEPVMLLLIEPGGRWKVTKNEDEVEFKKGLDGKIQSLIIYSNISLLRGEPVTNQLEKVILEEGMDAGLAWYDEVKKDEDKEYLFAEGFLNALGYKFLGNEKIDDAIAIFELNVKEHPDSFNVYDSLGEAYLKKGDKEKARINYTKSIEMNPENENGKKMLESLAF